MIKRRKRKRSKLLLLVIGAVFIYFFIKIVFNYLPVEVIQAKNSELEDMFAGEFIVLRQETVISAPYKGYFINTKNEGERVAKDTVIGYLEIIEGTSLEKTRSIPIKASVAGLVSYTTDGLESLCNPELWKQLDLDKLETLHNLEIKSGERESKGNNEEGNNRGNGLFKAGEDICKIVDNLDCFYFYLIGSGAYPERIKEGSSIKIKLDSDSNKDLVLRGNVMDISRKTGEYRILLKISTAGDLNLQRYEKGQIISGTYKGIVLPEKVLVVKDGKNGVYLLKKGRASWQEVERIAQLQGKVVISGLAETDWVITAPQLVSEGKRVSRINN